MCAAAIAPRQQCSNRATRVERVCDDISDRCVIPLVNLKRWASAFRRCNFYFGSILQRWFDLMMKNQEGLSDAYDG